MAPSDWSSIIHWPRVLGIRRLKRIGRPGAVGSRSDGQINTVRLVAWLARSRIAGARNGLLGLELAPSTPYITGMTSVT